MTTAEAAGILGGVVTTRNLVRNSASQIVMEYSPTRLVAGPPESDGIHS